MGSEEIYMNENFEFSQKSCKSKLTNDILCLKEAYIC